MSSQVVIDGFNLIYKFPDLEEYMVRNRLLEARQGLLERIESYSQKKKEQTFHVFFDGKKEVGSEIFQETFGKLNVYFSHGRKADDVIKEFVRTNARPSEIEVVSSDKEIFFHAKKWGANPIASEDFATIVIAEIFPSKPDTEKFEDRILNSEEVEHWKNLFREDE
ncbi:NYN domain-containing protein [Leptospira borgpetersenii]|uniref:NYN domain-containing protein n=1 Tax=Leptospira borgpetersenii TaxID=174 RepID=UPI001881C3BE|nr:NYN domain-containing protein [Leptospira borgpetersenii]MBE8364400.1 NYN domain-containing protein [Leptospira borgpetersenii serovar Balcanica]MBE8366740.1 NYN domain-containing protein [Leptospira borgpetersenii serovar Balcanica]MBE8423509.1 NYN domain-containing protein [Leptospira borgpetersenii serovar Balcanica]MBF3350573.1 NYN domain-containing protein [Leptospira borgpetersenii serovar Balcanica]